MDAQRRKFNNPNMKGGNKGKRPSTSTRVQSATTTVAVPFSTKAMQRVCKPHGAWSCGVRSQPQNELNISGSEPQDGILRHPDALNSASEHVATMNSTIQDYSPTEAFPARTLNNAKRALLEGAAEPELPAAPPLHMSI